MILRAQLTAELNYDLIMRRQINAENAAARPMIVSEVSACYMTHKSEASPANVPPNHACIKACIPPILRISGRSSEAEEGPTLTEYLQSASTAACRGVCLAADEQLTAAERANEMLEAAFVLLAASFIS